MIVTLLHSSKTMHRPQEHANPLGRPVFTKKAQALVNTWSKASFAEIETCMHISSKKAAEVAQLYKEWSIDEAHQIPAIDAFIGDIYSGLQVQYWTKQDRRYAHDHLLILSGLYGALRACDGIMPYRLEMGYKLPDNTNMYRFWSNLLAILLPASTEYVLNLSAVEYTKAILPYLDASIITPKFLTMSEKTGEPVFVAVHAKIARGAYARWVMQQRIESPEQLEEFRELGYQYDKKMSTDEQPVFICKSFGGLGLSVRLNP